MVEIIWFLIALPFRLAWRFLCFVLVKTDPDYKAFRASLDIPHSMDQYWQFVDERREFEQNPEPGVPPYDRKDPDQWYDTPDPETQEEEPEDDQDPEPEPDPEPKSKPNSKTPLQQAENLLGLVTGQYDEAKLKQKHREFAKVFHTDGGGGSHELSVQINNARDVIRKHHGWK